MTGLDLLLNESLRQAAAEYHEKSCTGFLQREVNMDIRSDATASGKFIICTLRIFLYLILREDFFVSCAQIFEAYAVRTLIKFGCGWRKIDRKSRCRKDSESTS